jgi:outer membrane scaffolding protein for murein synthesis (MipA/OmpV family)
MNRSITGGLLALCLLLSLPGRADHVPGHPKLEWGPAVALITTPDYIGSSHSQSYLLPFPYIKYRGKILVIDDGVEARLFDKPGLLLSVSGNGNLPSPEQNDERAGMDKLEASVELGPSLEYRLFDFEEDALWLEIPLRLAVTASKNISAIGKVFTPRLAWRKPAIGKYDWKLRLAAGPIYADKDFLDHVYAVDASEVTATRSEYAAQAGYNGFRIDFTWSRRFGQFWFGGFMRHDNLAGSVIEDSPLVSQTRSFTAGLSLAWVISEK